MGKRLQTRFSDLNQRIIKRSKKDKTILKRKSTTNLEDPPKKVSKLNRKAQDDLLLTQEINKETVYVEKLNKLSDIVLKTREHVSYDLFFSDELKNNDFSYTSRDLYFHIIDEIALEGLDGITIEAFWKRLKIALEGPFYVDQHIQNFIWQNVILTHKNFQCFKLPMPRLELDIYNPFDYMNTEIGVVMEVAFQFPDIYPFAPVNNQAVLGSCATFKERVNITEEIKNLTVEEIEVRYGRKLVIVADQCLRTHALCGELVDPCTEFLNVEYSILERIARSRKLGELTQGNMSLPLASKMDSKSVFHYKKHLYQSGLISKQFFVIKSAIMDQNKSGSLLHLKRFYTNIRSRQSCIADQIVNVLRSQPDYRMDSKSLRQLFAHNISSVSRLLKNTEFKKFVRSKTFPYRTLFPNATSFEYLSKNRSEKAVLGYELLDPHINVAAYWRMNEQDDDDGEGDEKDEELSGHKRYKEDTLRDIYYHIYLAGEKGCSGLDIRKKVGLDKNTARLALNKLLSKAIIDFTPFGDGRQWKYIYKVRCPNKKPEDLPITSTNSSNIKISSIKTRMLERQKAALAKKKQENLNKPQPIQQTTCDNFLKMDKPTISNTEFLVRKEIPPLESILNVSLFPIRLNKMYTVHLTYLSLRMDSKFNINQLLEEILPRVRTPVIISNFKEFYIKKYDFDRETKLLLFKALLGDSVIKKETSEDKLHNEINERMPPNIEEHKPLTIQQSKLNYMGPNPIVVFREEERGVKVEIVASTPPAEIKLETVYPRVKSETERMCDRIQIILDLLNEEGVIEELHTLNKFVIEKETNNGSEKKIDRKSLIRILKRLVEEGYIKIFKLVLNNEAISKTTVFICHPLTEYTHDSIQSTCQQYKWKYFFSVANKLTTPHIPTIQKTIQEKFKSSPFSQTDVLNSISEMKQLRKSIMKEIKRKFNNRIGRVYGVKPKFTRMRIMHEFLFFIIYECTGIEMPLSTEEVHKLFKSNRITLTEDELNELPKVYRNEISWKMFIPSLPVHTGWPEGWALMCDIILRLPVSILLKLHNCSYEDSELLEILNHPVKKFYLVKDLSERTRKTVLFKRKYLFDIYENISRLVFCGLMQFGPQRYKEKDQVFIYLNRRASILDTRSSAPGYNEIEKKEYPKMSFYFRTHADVEYYWQQLSNISMNTKLNTREPGKLVTLVYINTKPDLSQSIKSRTAEEAQLFDTGTIPGDGKGAAGLDSALWPHLVRNWFHTEGNLGNSLFSESKQTKLPVQVSTSVKSFNELRLKPTKFYLANASKANLNVSTLKKITGIKSKKKRIIRRILQQRKSKPRKREYSDAIDKNILKKISGRRTKWSKNEDEIVYLLRAADIFITNGTPYRRQVVPLTVVRDLLHRISAESKFKTSRAIQRRWNKLQKTSYQRLEDSVSNLLKIPIIKEVYGPLLAKKKTVDENSRKIFRLSEQQVSVAFIILASYILRNKKKVQDVLQGNLVNIDHLSEENLQYTEKNIMPIEKRDLKYADAKNENDIRKDVVKAIIHSSLCSKDGPYNLTTRLLKIYQHYSDLQLREAVRELRETNTITCRKWKDRKLKIWDTPFALSQFYIFFQYSTFNATSAVESYNAFLSIVKDRGENFKSDEETVQNKRYGQLLGVNEFFSIADVVDFHFNLPQNTVTLNHKFQNHDQLVHELAVRYQLKLKAIQSENNDIEVDLEDTDNFRTRDNQDLDEEKQTSDLADQVVAVPVDAQDAQTSPLDLTVDTGNNDTIDRLKTWITDRVQTDIERRSPSPEFMSRQIKSDDDRNKNDYTLRVIDESFEENDNAGRNSDSEKQIPSLEEIKTGMLKLNVNNEERTIPHITELSDLLKENFPDLKSDADLVELKAHFITEYATLDSITVNDFEYVQNHPLVKYIDDTFRNELLWERIENDIIVRDFLIMPNFEELIRKDGGNEEDTRLALDIVEFAATKTFYGATGQEIKANFSHREKNCSLISIMKNLLKAEILIKTGICTLSFVHYTYQYMWVVQQSTVNVDPNIKEDETDDRQKLCSIRIMPWVTVNGSLNKPTLKIWICNVLSYCLDYPKVQFSKLCDKYCYIKPVDLYFIVQILEELQSVELLTYDLEEESILTEWKPPIERAATILDDLEDIVIQPRNISMSCLGSFLSRAPL